ncbi:MAG: PH domain-containing protein [Halomonas sp.]|nr:PH domain-containing protein [Halomonas sp.]MCC5883021.1 PH domain-containing protein [Halomonas sp.]
MSEALRPTRKNEQKQPGWQRLSPWAVLLLLLSGGVTLVRQHLPLVLGAGAGLTMLERLGLRELALGGATLLGLAMLCSLLYYRRFRYRCDGDVLIVQKGLLEHREFKVAARHVQSIVTHQPVYMRPFGLVLWEVETQAGEASRIALPGIRRECAEALERELRSSTDLAPSLQGQRNATPSEDRASARRAAPHFTLNGKAIVLHGLASRSIFVIAAMLSPFVRPLERWVHDVLPQLDLAAWQPASPWVTIALGILLVVATLSVLAILAAWWRFHGYELFDEGDRQVQRSGLVHRQEQTLSLSRLQVVEWVQTGLGRLLGRGYLVCHQYGSSGGDAAESRRFLVPGLTEAQHEWLTVRFWPGYAAGQPLQRVDSSYRRVLLLRHVLLSTGAAVLVEVLAPGQLSLLAWGGLAGGLLLLSSALAQWRWIATGWAKENSYLRIRRGILGQRTGVFPLQHLISLRVQQSWLQRRRGVATLHLELANGRQTLPYLNAKEAHRLADALLFSAENAQLA